MRKTLYTIVQHSGYGYAGKEEFERGLEVRSVTDGRFQNKIRTLGGLLFESSGDAYDYEEKESYRNVSGLIPNAPGTFSDYEVDGLRLYIPKEVGSP